MLGRRSSDLEDLLVLLRQRIVDPLDVIVGQMLDLTLQLAALVLRDLGVLLPSLEDLDAVTPHIANRYPGVFGVFGGDARQIAAPLLIQVRDWHPDRLTLGLRVE